MISAAFSSSRTVTDHRRDLLEVWLAFTAMVLFIFATLEAAPIFSRFLWQRDLFLSTLSWLFGGALVFLGHYILTVVRVRSVLRLSALAVLGAVYVRVLLDTGRIERFHMLEYGILTFLGLKALSRRVRSLWLYPAGFVMVFAVSFADEGIQELLPSRYFVWEDVLINARSVGLAVLFLAVLHGRNSAGFSLPFFGEDRRGPVGAS